VNVIAPAAPRSQEGEDMEDGWICQYIDIYYIILNKPPIRVPN
jgi:hypothetical protein